MYVYIYIYIHSLIHLFIALLLLELEGRGQHENGLCYDIQYHTILCDTITSYMCLSSGSPSSRTGRTWTSPSAPRRAGPTGSCPTPSSPRS